MTQPVYDSHVIAALDDAIRRLRAVRYLGEQRNEHGQLLGSLWNDDGGTKTSFLVTPGETLGEALDHVDARFRQGSGAWTEQE